MERSDRFDMDFKKLTYIPLDKARNDYLDTLAQNGMGIQTERIKVIDAGEKTTAEPIYAVICSPLHNSGAMDGIALDAKLTIGANEDNQITLTTGQFKEIETGEALPKDCNAVVMYEEITRLDDGSIELKKEAYPWQNIRRIGEDICIGEMIMLSYSKITPSALGAMIAGGVTEVSVIKKPLVAIIPTNNEATCRTNMQKDEKTLECNCTIFSAMLESWGAQTITYKAVRDNREEISRALEKAIAQCDIVIVNTSSPDSLGNCTYEAINSVGEVLYHGIAIKPGKSVILGCAGAKPILGVPGYPVSGIIVIEQILRPIIELLSKSTPEIIKHANAVLSKAVVSDPLYHEFVRVRMGYVGEKLIASPLGRGSGIVTSFMKADGLLEIPQESGGYDSGEKVNIRLLEPKESLKNRLIVTGSHDPLLDELAELLRTQYGDISMSSAHVGSMGGLISIRRGETHVAAIHLLDVKTGQYNTSFIKKMLPKTNVRLISCVKRTQGIIVKKGNPLGITGISDLIQNGLRYVNRQKGSGTRILFDYLCEKENIDSSKILGYDKQEFTHNGVATLIATGSADAGMGIYSAAKLHDMDFIEICREQYDLLIPDYSWELPMVQKLISVLGSEQFKKKLNALGGYQLDNPGVVREIIGNR